MSTRPHHDHGCGCSGQPSSAAAQPAPAWADSADKGGPDIHALDVRPILADGGEPFAAIMNAADRVPEGGVLVLDAPFDPVPLKSVLGGRGFVSYSRPLAADHWRVYFRHEPRNVEKTAPRAAAGVRMWREGDEQHVDVRGLEPPQPMLAILKFIDNSPAVRTLVVHHEREPIFLYPELAERGWTHAIVPGEPGEVRLRLARSAP